MPPTPLQELDLYAVDSGTGYVSNTTTRIGIRVLPEPAMVPVGSFQSLTSWRL